MKTLNCMSTHMDGAHCGLADWYSEIEEGIQEALNEGPEYEWTTGWYASKKEIASACITSSEGSLCIEASVSDDFDTPGLGSLTIPHTTDLDVVRDTIYKAWDAAEIDQKANRLYAGYSVLTEVESYAMYIGGKPQGEPVRRQGWVETYVKPVGDGHWFDQPPGDNYHQWGFQEEYEMPESVKEKLAEWAESNDSGEFSFEGFTIKPWDD